MIGQRNAWIAARARNAARRGGWIAGLGGIAVVATLLALVSAPRALDRQLRQRIAALPVPRDSTPIVQRLDSLRGLQRIQQRDSVVTIAPARPDSALPPVVNESTVVRAAASKPDSAMIDLMARITRARRAPLPDSYRALAESPLLKDDPRARQLLDSIDLVDREREAHAALGGPDARYAALTARLTALGQGLVRLAEARLANALLANIDAMRASPREAPDSVPRPVAPAPADSIRRMTRAVLRDSLRDSLRRDTLARRVVQEESLLVSARRALADVDAQRTALERRLTVELPSFAIVVAALVVGGAFGYGVVLARELRRPTVGDAPEIERLTGAPVLRHTPDTASVDVARGALRERPGIPRIIDRESDTFVLLHLALTGVGDVVDQADVLGDDPLISAAVALGIAAAAARESRAVLVVEDTERQPVLAPLLGKTPTSPRAGAHTPGATTSDAVHVVTLDRDAHIDVLFGEADTGSHDSVEDRLSRLFAGYDLRLRLPGADATTAGRDVILCVRQGATPLAWLSRATRRARRRQQRVRAVVLWSRDVPAGS